MLQLFFVGPIFDPSLYATKNLTLMAPLGSSSSHWEAQDQ